MFLNWVLFIPQFAIYQTLLFDRTESSHPEADLLLREYGQYINHIFLLEKNKLEKKSKKII